MVAGILEHDHLQISELLHDLQSGLQQQDAARTLDLLDLFWARLAVHIRAENLCLFPAILDAARGFSYRNDLPSLEEAEEAIKTLRSDHKFFMDELAKAMKTSRAIIRDAESAPRATAQLATIRDRVNAVWLRLESHNALEEEQVYRWPALILSAPDLERLRASLKRELENLPPRLADRA